MESPEGASPEARRYPPYLRLVWSQPEPRPRPEHRRTDLALAIARHIAGEDGLTDQEFVRLYARG